MTERPTVAGAMAHAESAHAKIQSHEDICAVRYKALNDTLGELKEGAKHATRVQWGILLAILGFLAVQVYDDLSEGHHETPSASAGQ